MTPLAARVLTADLARRLTAPKGGPDPRVQHAGGWPIRYLTRTPGRNESCPCGSGKKFKSCHAVGPETADAEANAVRR